MNIPLPGTTGPAAGFDQPFELLAGCHERVRRSLALLLRLVAHVDQHGIEASGRSAAKDVLRYFDIAAPLHHQDEEQHIVPTLQASDDAALRAIAEQMLADHARMALDWAELRQPLQAIVDAPDGAEVDLARLQRQAEAFVELHRPHLAIEDGTAFPAASMQVDEEIRRGMGNEMAQRRGVKILESGDDR